MPSHTNSHTFNKNVCERKLCVRALLPDTGEVQVVQIVHTLDGHDLPRSGRVDAQGQQSRLWERLEARGRAHKPVQVGMDGDT